MARLIVVLEEIGVTIYAVVDCLRTEDSELRGLPKPLWLLVIVLLLPVGGVLWLLLGRQAPPRGPNRGGRPRVIAPDDDPDFLRRLDQERLRKHDRTGTEDGDADT